MKRFVLLLVVLSAVIAVAAANADTTVKTSFTYTANYGDAGWGSLDVTDACGGSGTFRITSGSWEWQSTVHLLPYTYPTGDPAFQFVRGRATVTYSLSGVTANGVTYTGWGRASSTDFHGGQQFVRIQTVDNLRGSDGSVLQIQQEWDAQYTNGFFLNGQLDAAGITYGTFGGTCLRH